MSKEWAVELAGHPDREFRDYILKGISHSFHIGFDYGRYTCRPASSNMGSSSKNVEVVQPYLDKEVVLGRIMCVCLFMGCRESLRKRLHPHAILNLTKSG